MAVGSQRRPYRVLFDDDLGDGTIRRGTVTVGDLDQARREAQAIALEGRRAEVHYVNEDGERAQLEEYSP